MSLDKMHVNYKNKNNQMKNLYSSFIQSIFNSTSNGVCIGLVLTVLGSPGFAQTIDFSVSPTSSCTGSNVTFTNLTTEPGAVTYKWYFSDGTPMFQENFSTTVNHTFANNGTFYVLMEVYDGLGSMVGSMTRPAEVNGISSWDQLTVYPDDACLGEDISFNAPWGYSQYIFNRGDGSPDDTTINNWMNTQYTTPGTYASSVTILNVCGGADTTLFDTITINASMYFPAWINAYSWPSNACPDEGVSFESPWGFASYTWMFGDGDTVTTTNANIIHKYDAEGTYAVSVRVYNYCGDDTTLTLTQTIQYPPFPTMSLYVSPAQVCPGENIYLSVPWGYVSYVWDFGDGSPLDTSLDAYKYHIYDSLGLYTPSVTLTQFCGNDTTISGTVDVNSYVPFPSAASLATGPNPACPYESIYLYGPGGYQNYEWDFGDGSPVENGSSGYNNHIYTSAGTYAASLTITNLCGNDTTLIDTVTIDNNLPLPGSISYILSSNPTCPGNVNFEASMGYQF